MTPRSAIADDGPDKTCTRCGETKSVTQFYRNRNECFPCRNEYLRQAATFRFYAITQEDYDKISEHQNGVCALCRRPPKTDPGSRRLAVDHDHKSGLVRGLLCWACNSFLGKIHDNPDIAARAAEYLTMPPATKALGEERYGIKGSVNKFRKKPRKRKGKYPRRAGE